MAVPIIIGTVAAGSALYGAYKGVKGAVDKSDANDINAQASAMVDDANEALDEQRESTNMKLADYGSRKLRTFNEQVSAFITTYERLKNVELEGSVVQDKLNQDDFSTTAMPEFKSGEMLQASVLGLTYAGVNTATVLALMSELKRDYTMLQASGFGLASGAGSGTALAFGAYSGTMALATASTGTAIGTLSGAAATNATLAWLGGGSLAAGGFGMAGGMMVLGGIVAGPALAIFGHFVGNAGEEALNNARANLEQARTIDKQSKLMVTKLRTIADVVALANKAFSRISRELRRSVEALQATIDAQGEDYSAFDQAGRETVLRSVKFAQLTKAMIDTPILDEDGRLLLSTKRAHAIYDASGDADATLSVLNEPDSDWFREEFEARKKEMEELMKQVEQLEDEPE